jgi:hypothetical protein
MDSADPAAGFVYSDPQNYKYSYQPYQIKGSCQECDTVWMFYQIGPNGDTLNTNALWGYSELQRQYIDKLHVSNKYYRISQNVLFLLIANHIISAVDAMISAKAHNDRLLGKESFWRHINLDQRVAYTGTDIRSTFGIKVRF